MSRADVVGLAMAGVLAIVALVLMAGCSARPEEPWLCLYGEPPSDQVVQALADALPKMPASPWDCVASIHITERPDCRPGQATCFWPDSYRIDTTQAGLVHEMKHAAALCAYGHADNLHALPFWNP